MARDVLHATVEAGLTRRGASNEVVRGTEEAQERGQDPRARNGLIVIHQQQG